MSVILLREKKQAGSGIICFLNFLIHHLQYHFVRTSRRSHEFVYIWVMKIRNLCKFEIMSFLEVEDSDYQRYFIDFCDIQLLVDSWHFIPHTFLVRNSDVSQTDVILANVKNNTFLTHTSIMIQFLKGYRWRICRNDLKHFSPRDLNFVLTIRSRTSDMSRGIFRQLPSLTDDVLISKDETVHQEVDHLLWTSVMNWMNYNFKM